MCCERRRAEACVDSPAHYALVNAGERQIVCKKEGEKQGSERPGVRALELLPGGRGGKRPVVKYVLLILRHLF